MSNAVLRHILAVFAVMYFDTKKYCVQEGWNVTEADHQYHT